MLIRLIASAASALHLWWAVALILDSQACGSTACDAIPLPSRWSIVALLLVSALLAELGIFGRFGPRGGFAAMIPQQVVLWWGAAGSLKAIWLSQYAHNSPPGIHRGFIASDQAPMIVIAVLYAVGLLMVARGLMRVNGRHL